MLKNHFIPIILMWKIKTYMFLNQQVVVKKKTDKSGAVLFMKPMSPIAASKGFQSIGQWGFF